MGDLYLDLCGAAIKTNSRAKETIWLVAYSLHALERASSPYLRKDIAGISAHRVSPLDFKESEKCPQ